MIIRSPKLLLINGITLAAIGMLQFVLDFLGYWHGIGPTGNTLHGNLDAIGFVEAHGLAAILGMLLILHRNAGARWHIVACAVHLLLGGSNLIFWPIFFQAGLVEMGVGATTLHAVFFGLNALILIKPDHSDGQ